MNPFRSPHFLIPKIATIVLLGSSAIFCSADETLKTSGPDNLRIGSLSNWHHAISDDPRPKIMREFIESDCNLVSIAAGWGQIWKGPEEFDFKRPLDIVKAYEKNDDMAFHGWLPVGNSGHLPTWLMGDRKVEGAREKRYQYWRKNKEPLRKILENIIREYTTTLEKAHPIDYWTVVNEPFWLPGGSYYAGCIWRPLGMEPDKSGLTGEQQVVKEHPKYIRLAFEYAAKHAKGKLAIRERRVEFPSGSVTAPKTEEDEHPDVGVGDHYDVYFQLVKHLLNSGVKLDAVEYQAHLNAHWEYDWDAFTAGIKRYTDMGLEVHIGELDVGHDGSPEGLERQKMTYHNAVKAAIKGGANFVCLWGVVQGSMGTYREDADALILHENGNPKPAYHGLLEALKEVSEVPLNQR